MTTARGPTLWYALLPFLLAICFGCVHVPLSSTLTGEDRLEKILPVDEGDVVVVYGENAMNPWKDTMASYFTADCMAVFHPNTVGGLITTMLKVNPRPGLFAVKHLSELGTGAGAGPPPPGQDSILRRLNLSKTKVVTDRLRYAIHVKETFEVTVHVPLYAPPFGIASCGNRTELEAAVWDLPAERFMGSLLVSAEGEYTVTAYLLHVVSFRDTQKDATERLAREIVERLTGARALEEKGD